MRTKTLLLTAALGAAGIATSMAQVYSQNAVGYINLQLVPGFNMIANQLIPASYRLDALIPAPPPGTQVYKFTPGTGFALSTFDALDLTWDNGALTLNLGLGFWIQVPTAYTLTFVGEVPQGAALTTPTPLGFSMVASQVPQQGTATQLGLTVGGGDSVYRYAPGVGFTLYTFDALDLAWNTPPGEPSFNVGEGFWLLRSGPTPANWVRSFSVN